MLNLQTDIVQDQKCDLVAIGREALFNPNWALHSEIELNEDSNFNNWPNQYGWWLDKRKKCPTNKFFAI